MNQEQRNEWKSLPNILAAIGLIISFSGNVVLYLEYRNAGREALIQTDRANTEEKRANELERQRTTWSGDLTGEIQTITKEIQTLENDIQIAQINKNSIDPNVSTAAIRTVQNGDARLDALKARKSSLETQLNELLTSRN